MMKRLLALMMAAMLLFALTGCAPAADPDQTVPPTTEDTAPPVEDTTLSTSPDYPETDNPVTFFSLSLGQDYENIHSITVSANDDGTAHVEYVADVKKVGELDANVFHGITAAFEDSGLAALNGQDAWSEGEANGSMYIEFADGSYVGAGFSGEIPESYSQGYAVMDAFFAQLSESLPVYVPQPVVMGAVDPMLLDEIMAILEGGGLQNPDTFTISHVEKDEYFAYTLGLGSDRGIEKAVSLAPMMMPTAYSLVIVTLESGTDSRSVCDDFLEHLNWTKWVCVAPTNALIAVKDNMVLCLMAADALYTQTAAGVEAAGWTVVETPENR